MFSHPFMQNAFLAGTATAVLCGLVGYFLVLREQVFTGDALSHVAFTGSLGALAFGFAARVGLFGATVGVAVLLAAIAARRRPDDVVIGSVFAWVLGLGVLFLSIFTSRSATGNSQGGAAVLFGSIFGLGRGDAVIAVVVAGAGAGAVAFMARPLLFASLDEDVARSRGVPVRALGYAFMVLAGATAAEATQAVGALLLLGLLTAPAAAAGRLSARPFRALAASAAIAVGAVWAGLAISYVAPRTPPSFAIVAVATAAYALTRVVVRS
jgi:zinc/manganese transport system permease protein